MKAPRRDLTFKVDSLDVEEDVSLLVKNRPDVTDGHGGIVHLKPLTVARLGDTDEGAATLTKRQAQISANWPKSRHRTLI